MESRTYSSFLTKIKRLNNQGCVKSTSLVIQSRNHLNLHLKLRPLLLLIRFQYRLDKGHASQSLFHTREIMYFWIIARVVAGLGTEASGAVLHRFFAPSGPKGVGKVAVDASKGFHISLGMPRRLSGMGLGIEGKVAYSRAEDARAFFLVGQDQCVGFLLPPFQTSKLAIDPDIEVIFLSIADLAIV